jgi:predicted SprT family Zn-dependent metalloprotease
MQAKVEAVKAKVAQCIALAESKFGIKMPAIQIRFDLTGRAAGMAGCKLDRFERTAHDMYLRFNTVHMRLGGQSWEHILNDTVPHEVAHSVCQAFPQFGRNHDAGWKRVCVALGGNGSRCYKQEDAPEAVAKAKPYAYTTSTGHIVAVSPVIHRKIQTRGASYMFRGKGRVSKAQPYTMTNASMLTAPTVTKVAAPIAPAKAVDIMARMRMPVVAQHSGSSNAERIRAYITIAKADSGSEAFEKAVQYGIVALGMKAALARTYVKNNWDRC